MDTTIIWAVFTALLPHIPVMLVTLVGMAAAIANRDKLRDVAILTFLGFVIIAAVTVVQPILYVLLPRLWTGLPRTSLTTIYSVIAFLFNALFAGALVLLLVAILRPRAS